MAEKMAAKVGSQNSNMPNRAEILFDGALHNSSVELATGSGIFWVIIAGIDSGGAHICRAALYNNMHGQSSWNNVYEVFAQDPDNYLSITMTNTYKITLTCLSTNDCHYTIVKLTNINWT